MSFDTMPPENILPLQRKHRTMRATVLPLILTLALLVGCSANTNKLVGTWNLAGHPEMIWSFASDGTFKVTGSTSSSTYKLNDNGTTLVLSSPTDKTPVSEALTWTDNNTFSFQEKDTFMGGMVTLVFLRRPS